MRLDQFIETTLSEIALGVAKAKVRSKDLVSIAPGNVGGVARQTESTVTFDVSLSVSDAEEGSSGASGKAGSKLKVFVVDADVAVDGHAARKRTRSEEANHRVSFAIPILLSAHHRDDPSMGPEAQLIGQIDEAWFGGGHIE